MSEEKRVTLPLTAAYPFGVAKGLDAEINKIKDMEIEWDSPYTSSLRRGYIVDLFQRHGIFEEFKAKHWPFANTPAGASQPQRFLRIKEQYEDFLAGRAPDREREEHDDAQEFPAEAALRDFLAKNPSCIEQGLRLYESGDRSGIEFSVGDGRIDILAVDRNGHFVVVELKVSRGRSRTIGQLLYYMGWVDKNLGHGPCRGMIIAREISDDLILAVRRVPGITLCSYNLSVSVELVKQKD